MHFQTLANPGQLCAPKVPVAQQDGLQFLGLALHTRTAEREPENTSASHRQFFFCSRSKTGNELDTVVLDNEDRWRSTKIRAQ